MLADGIRDRDIEGTLLSDGNRLGTLLGAPLSLGVEFGRDEGTVDDDGISLGADDGIELVLGVGEGTEDGTELDEGEKLGIGLVLNLVATTGSYLSLAIATVTLKGRSLPTATRLVLRLGRYYHLDPHCLKGPAKESWTEHR